MDEDAVFCMNCGVKISDDTSSKYCAYCGHKLEEEVKRTVESEKIIVETKTDTIPSTEEKTTPLQIMKSDLYQILEAKEQSMPRRLTKRNVISKEWWNGEISIYSNALFLCKSNFMVEDIKQTFLDYYTQNRKIKNKVLEENIPECFKGAIKLALRDCKNIKNGDSYFVVVEEYRKYQWTLNCVIQIEGNLYKYIIGFNV
ncbi:MAG: zinc ribbon domain-containing protein [Treponema sp.]|nr:zinc ribbon domain-containing protein [Treponema sp.]